MALVQPWHPISDTTDLKSLGKLAEELGEASAAVARCIIQGVGEAEPITGKPNKRWLEEELADVLVNINIVAERFDLDNEFIETRSASKYKDLKYWHSL